MGDCPNGNRTDTSVAWRADAARRRAGSDRDSGGGCAGPDRRLRHRAAPLAAARAAPSIEYAAPTAGIGAPDGRKGIQEQVTEVGRDAAAFHNGPLLIMCAAISMFVLILLGWTMVKFRRGANPIPSRTSHNTLIEVIWTVVPVLILVAIAIPSIRLISKQYSPPPADVTVKVIGNQWYWTYQYPDNGGFEIVSNMLKEKDEVTGRARFRTDADGPELLAADERLVIPAGKVVKFIITSADVIHAFAVPAFWTKMDATPGRLNETWVKVDRPGVYYRPVQRIVRRAPRLHADRGRGRPRSDLQRLARVEGRHAQGRQAEHRSDLVERAGARRGAAGGDRGHARGRSRRGRPAGAQPGRHGQ